MDMGLNVQVFSLRPMMQRRFLGESMKQPINQTFT